MINKIKKIFCKKEQDLEPSVLEKIDNMFEDLESDVITLLIGEDFIEYSDSILETISDYREELKEVTGFILPPVRVTSKSFLQENEFVLKVCEKEVFQQFVIPNEEHIVEDIRKSMEYLFENHLNEIFTCEITEKYINFVQNKRPYTIWNISVMYTIEEIREVLVNILMRKKSIKDVNNIFDKFVQCSLKSGFCSHVSTDKIANNIIKKL